LHREVHGDRRLILVGGQDGECCPVGRTEVAATIVSGAVNTSVVIIIIIKRNIYGGLNRKSISRTTIRGKVDSQAAL